MRTKPLFSLLSLFFLMVVVGALVSDADASPKGGWVTIYEIEFKIESIECLNGEEDGYGMFSSGDDEIFGAFSLNEVSGDIVIQSTGGAGGLFKGVKKGDIIWNRGRKKDFPVRELVVRDDSAIEITIWLWESDDPDAKAARTIVRGINSATKYPINWIESGEGPQWAKEVLKSSTWFFGEVAKVPFRMAALDGNDTLGVKGPYRHELPSDARAEAVLNESVTIKGSNKLDDYEYIINYSLKARAIDQHFEIHF